MQKSNTLVNPTTGENQNHQQDNQGVHRRNQFASSEAPKLVFMANMETMEELGGGGGEESHTSGGEEDVGGVE